MIDLTLEALTRQSQAASCMAATAVRDLQAAVVRLNIVNAKLRKALKHAQEGREGGSDGLACEGCRNTHPSTFEAARTHSRGPQRHHEGEA